MIPGINMFDSQYLAHKTISIYEQKVPKDMNPGLCTNWVNPKPSFDEDSIEHDMDVKNASLIISMV